MSDPGPENPASSRRLLRWALLFPALLVPFILSFFYFVYFPGTTFGNAFYGVHKVFLIAWPLLCVLAFLREPMIDRSRPKRHLGSLLPGVLFGLLVTGVMFLLLESPVLGELFSANREKIVQRIHDLGVADRFFQFALFISFMHSAMEEFYWRWFTFGQAKRIMPKGAAHLVAAIGFSLHHIVVMTQFFPLGWALGLGACVGIGGAFWSWQADRYNSLLGPWFSHLLVDLGLMWVGWQALQGSL
ncbi:MAG: CPBP family intramembrane metalloprotease [Verrucomicrobiae bacterium]|nr:CPBP family intramembrane metalloprotease [Verrucomicrobiae bacterium]